MKNLARVSATLCSLIMALITAAPASAQSFNIDFDQPSSPNTPPGSGNDPPSSAFGAASGQAGFWQSIGAGAATMQTNIPISLNGLDGLGTAATLTRTSSAFVGIFNFQTGITGDDEELMNDWLDLESGNVYTFRVDNLQNGQYDVYSYAWSGESSSFRTSVNVNSLGAQIVGGVWPSGYVQGVTHALHTVNVVDGTINISIAAHMSSFGAFNGLQIVQVPGPGALALLGMAGLISRRRRRA